MSNKDRSVKQFSRTIVFDSQNLLMSLTGANNVHLRALEYFFVLEAFVHGNMITIRSESHKTVECADRFMQVLIQRAKRGESITKEYMSSLFLSMFDSTRVEHLNESNYDSENTLSFPSQEKQSMGITSKTTAEPSLNRKESEKKMQSQLHIQNEMDLLTSSKHEFPTIDIPVIQSNTRNHDEKKKTIIPRSKNQLRAIEAIQTSSLTFLVGPAGTGKTLLTTAYAFSQLMSKHIQRYIVTRPVVEAGEKLGYLPGDLYQKILPYMRPIFDELHSLSSDHIVEVLQEKNQIEIAPLAYMRGRTLKQCIVLFDEAQNSTPMQMRMFLTRLGEGAKAVVTGDVSQSDLPGKNGLSEAVQVFKNTKGVAIVTLEEEDIQRSHIARIVINAYNDYDRYKAQNTEDRRSNK